MLKPSLAIRVLSCMFVAATSVFAAGGQMSSSPKDIPLTTSSDAARRAFQGGLENIENQQTQRAHIDFRSAIRADADFALAHLFLAYDNGNPAEEMAELQKARELAPNASKPEQLMIEWMAGWRMGEMVPAISAMNDLVSEFPEDKFLLFLAGRWMITQHNYEGAQHFLERAVVADPNYAAALNELGYAYAGTRNYDRAFASLDKYVKLMPGEPNTEDSYGEISRMAGRYDQALEHFHKALSYDSTFIWSQVGLADTYLLMGKEEQARIEYAKAIAVAPSVGDRLTWEIQSGLTYMYEKRHKAADAAMDKVAEEAHSLHVGHAEAMTNRIMSEYDPELSGILEHSEDAERALAAKNDISATDRDEEMALVLKTRADQAAIFGDMDLANRTLKQLAEIAAGSRDGVILQANEGAIGGVLWAQKKYAEAIPHLEEDQANPLSAARLLIAYRQANDTRMADGLSAQLNSYHEATVDDLLARQLLKVSTHEK
ncbi:MAG TPA: tetratricopeptide repeat protein [Candidatus Koribacter sp.]|jgi:tetratricopeptide (TPR) repeat protein